MTDFFDNAKVSGSKEYWILWKYSLAFILSGFVLFLISTITVDKMLYEYRQIASSLLAAIGFLLIPALSEQQKDRIYKVFLRLFIMIFLFWTAFYYWFIWDKGSHIVSDIIFTIATFFVIKYIVQIIIQMYLSLSKLFQLVAEKLTATRENRNIIIVLIERITALLIPTTAFITAIYGLIQVFKK